MAKQRTILLSGGGTAGHITPTLHVARALKSLDPDVRLAYVMEKGSKFKDLVETSPLIDTRTYIFAGKLRRYHGGSRISKILDIKTLLLNCIDMCKVMLGTVQMICSFLFSRPDAVFAKGGFVVVPVGIAARLFRVPLITHDSDLAPGLANKIISRWAKLCTVATETTAKAYGSRTTQVVGIPLDESFHPVSTEEQRAIRNELELNPDHKILLVTGGSLGAQKLNEAMKEAIIRIVAQLNAITIVWVVGRQNVDSTDAWLQEQSEELQSAVLIKGFLHDMPHWFQAVDAIITRGGATALAEVTASQIPSMIVPAAFLPGGHQLDNAQELTGQGAAQLVHEQEDTTAYATELAHQAVRILTDDQLRSHMASKLAAIGRTDAADVLARLLLEATK